jgi:hypothetical protein
MRRKGQNFLPAGVLVLFSGMRLARFDRHLNQAGQGEIRIDASTVETGA